MNAAGEIADIRSRNQRYNVDAPLAHERAEFFETRGGID
jgi:hypothetical protein